MKGMQVGGITDMANPLSPPPAQAHTAERHGGGPPQASAVSPIMKTMIWCKAIIVQLYLLNHCTLLKYENELQHQHLPLKNLPQRRGGWLQLISRLSSRWCLKRGGARTALTIYRLQTRCRCRITFWHAIDVKNKGLARTINSVELCYEVPTHVCGCACALPVGEVR